MSSLSRRDCALARPSFYRARASECPRLSWRWSARAGSGRVRHPRAIVRRAIARVCARVRLLLSCAGPAQVSGRRSQECAWFALACAVSQVALSVRRSVLFLRISPKANPQQPSPN